MGFNSGETNIIATIGPSCDSEMMINQLVRAGVNTFNLDPANTSYKRQKSCIKVIHKTYQQLNENLMIIQNLTGPQIHTGMVEGDSIQLMSGYTLKLSMDNNFIGNAERIGVTHPGMHNDVGLGERILMDDGNLELKVIGFDNNNSPEIITEVVYGGVLHSKKGVNLPNSNIYLPALTKKDHYDLDFGLANGVDWVSLSFVRTADDIIELKKLIKDAGKATKVIAKIERPEAIDNIDEIIDAADGIMINRGNLGVEINKAKVPYRQKLIINKCMLANKPVIVGGQVLHSMKDRPFATSAEINDAYNIALDGATAIMLGDVTAQGEHPINAVSQLREVLEAVKENKN